MKVSYYIKISIFLICASSIIAQSDYRITQEFKSRHRSFEIAIEYAKTLEELDKIKKEINEFREEFKGNVELLNRALYPSNFDSSFKTLAKKVEYTNKKLTEITDLNTKVESIEAKFTQVSEELTNLSREVNVLRNTNSKLMNELRAFQTGYGESKESTDSLSQIIEELRKGISKRDTLIKEIMDNIFMTAEHKVETLDDAEMKSLRADIRSVSLIENISNLIHDNIEFLEASLLNFEDLKQLQTEYSDFASRWDHFGPKLINIYSNDDQNKNKLELIDTLMIDWNMSLNHSVWKSIHSVFLEYSISLDQFHNGNEFEEVVLTYIDEQINNPATEIEGNHNFVIFNDRVWTEIIKIKWVPFLLEKNIFEQQQIQNIDQKLEDWENNLGNSRSYLVYAIILILALIIIVSFILIKRRKSKIQTPTVSDPEIPIKKNEKDNDITIDDKFIDD